MGMTSFGAAPQLAPSDIQRAADAWHLPVDLLRAFIKVESGGNPCAWRTEAQYCYLWNCALAQPFRALTAAERTSELAPQDFTSAFGSRNTEWIGQQASWGPLQVMGAVARELGFRGPFPQLCGIAGLEYGCQHLHHLTLRYYRNTGWAGVAAAYNAGSPQQAAGGYVNQAYVDRIELAISAAGVRLASLTPGLDAGGPSHHA